MHTVDFVTALGRLLSDGKLRDGFASDPVGVARQMGVQEKDRASFLALVPGDLEFQARVLLRKRFDAIRRLLPRTGEKFAEHGWAEFYQFGRGRVPGPQELPVDEAIAFCGHLEKIQRGLVSAVEFNRLRFARGSRWFAGHWVGAVPVRRTLRPGFQLLLRFRSGRRHEWLVSFGF